MTTLRSCCRHRLVAVAAALVAIALPTSLAVAADAPMKRIVETPIADAPSFAKYALVIGVTDYEPPVAPLKVCVSDANNFANMLKSKFGFDNVVLLTDDPSQPRSARPTRRNIMRALATMYTGIIPAKSEVVFFYSGHGTRAPDSTGVDTDWLVPEDGDPTQVPETCVNFDSIRRTLDTKGPKRVLLVTDACRDLLNGKGVSANQFGRGAASSSFGPEVAELYSCQPKETSLEGDPQDFKESVFTHYLIKGLSGDPSASDPDKGAVTFDSLKTYVQYSVHQYAARLHSVQTPDGRASLGGMVLARYSGPKLDPTPPSITPQPPVTPNPQPSPGVSQVNPLDGAEMVLVPAGKFVMGDDDEKDNPKHSVMLTRFWIYKNLVTVAQYRAFCTATGQAMPAAPAWGWKDDHPIVNVGYNDARAYCAWAGGALPSEAQWEKAARGTTGQRFPWGDDFDALYVRGSRRKDGDIGSTAPVGRYAISPFGATDMAGNVWQWCQDWYAEEFWTAPGTAAKEDPINKSFGSKAGRILRGGSWMNYAEDEFRSAYRFSGNPGYVQPNVGFRCVKAGM